MIGFRRTLGGLMAAGGLLLATGCGGDAGANDKSDEACSSFADAQQQFAKYSYDGKGTMSLAEWQKAKSDTVAAMDSAGLSTSNVDVKERIGRVVDGIPADTTKVSTSRSTATAFNTNVAGVARACESAGFTIKVQEIPIIGYMGP